MSLVAVALTAACCRRQASEQRRRVEAEHRAERIWRERCVRCHGETGRGDGPLAATLRTPPRDFSDRAWQAGELDAELEGVIILGGPAMGYGADMPANLDLGEDPEATAALVRKIRSLADSR